MVLNDTKCEIITSDDNVVASIRAAMPNIRHIPSDGAIEEMILWVLLQFAQLRHWFSFLVVPDLLRS